ncbi:MAG: DUF2587 domain-containing protein, partial [Actinobacteria bacterium]|nr:DUF2587 domain-containing protein [Actinomycetota bacterium]
MAEIYERSIVELAEAISPDLREELQTLALPFKCRSAGINPIIGTEAYMAYESRFERPQRRGRVDDSGGDTEAGRKLYYHLTLLSENNTGYRNLIKLASLAFLEGY